MENEIYWKNNKQKKGDYLSIFHFPSGIWQPHVIYLEESSNKKRFRLHLIKENVGKIQNGLQIVVQR
jgi:hypothetical protein